MIKDFIHKLKSRTALFYSELAQNNQGMGTLEIVLIIIVILGLLVIFRDNIESIITSVFSKIHSQINSF